MINKQQKKTERVIKKSYTVCPIGVLKFVNELVQSIFEIRSVFDDQILI